MFPPYYVLRFSGFPGARLPFFPLNGFDLLGIFQEAVKVAVFLGVQVYGYGFFSPYTPASSLFTVSKEAPCF